MTGLDGWVVVVAVMVDIRCVCLMDAYRQIWIVVNANFFSLFFERCYGLRTWI